METVGQKLSAMRAEKGLSLMKVAKAGGWSGASSVQKFFEPHYDQQLRHAVAEKLAVSLGEGVLVLAGLATSSDRPAKIADVIALLRNTDIPADVRAAAAAEMLSRLM